MKTLLATFAILMAITFRISADDTKDAYEGFYWNEDRSAIVELRLTDTSIEGFTIWGPPEDAKDTKNTDTALQKRNIIGLKFLWGFEYSEKKNRWKNGKVYDPNNGKTYDAKMGLKKDGDILEMRGYVGVALLGRTAKFERVKTGNIPEGLLRAVKSTLQAD